MKLSEHIDSCQRMLERFGDGDVHIPSPEDILISAVRVSFHTDGIDNNYYTLDKVHIE